MKLTGKEILCDQYERWDIEVEGEHTFVAEGVVVHNSNCRLGIFHGQKVAGSMELRRSPPLDGDFSKSTYWFPWSVKGVNEMMEHLMESKSPFHNLPDHPMYVELFGEVYGNKIQSGFKYDSGNGIGFKVFGIKINDKFLNWDTLTEVCSYYGVPLVPVLYDGPFDFAIMMPLIEKDSTIGNAPVMEGGVVVACPERTDPKVGRAILKYISYRYDLLKNKPDCKDI